MACSKLVVKYSFVNGALASPEQHRDLVCFREIGVQYFEA